MMELPVFWSCTKKTFGHIVGVFSVLWYFDIAYPKKETSLGKITRITFSNHEETKIILSRLGALYFFSHTS